MTCSAIKHLSRPSPAKQGRPSPARAAVLFPLLCALLGLGCSALIPSERHQSAAVRTTEAIATESERTTQRTLSVTPEMALAVNRDSNVVAIPLGSSISETLKVTSRTGTGAGSKDTAIGTSTITIPLFVKVIGAAIGLLLLVAAIRYAVNAARGTAIGATLALADRSAGSVLDAIDSMLSTVTSESEISRLNALKAKAEKERGKLNQVKGGS